MLPRLTITLLILTKAIATDQCKNKIPHNTSRLISDFVANSLFDSGRIKTNINDYFYRAALSLLSQLVDYRLPSRCS